MELKTVGIYREMYEGGLDHLPSVYESVAAQHIPDREAVLKYLRKGPGVIDVMEGTPHLFDEQRLIPGGPSLHSDGLWVWRVDSIEYLAQQQLEIPTEFVEHVRAAGYEPPKSLDWTDEFDDAVMRYFRG
ncbi:hypothetical protein ACIRD8_24525 [Streptomyces sp. NPDC102451]|uniref:hypothetical protein n=1 Tax=Streptomyces sp. NPDC102451 TaxID=3366177 RepID=UPI00380FF0BE